MNPNIRERNEKRNQEIEEDLASDANGKRLGEQHIELFRERERAIAPEHCGTEYVAEEGARGSGGAHR